MPYSDKPYFLTKISEAELNKLTNSTDANLDSAIAAADSLIDSYLSSVVKVLPLSPVPEIIKQYSYDIAIFHLHDRIQYVDIPEWVKSKYDAAIFHLKDIARGQANIPGLEVTNVEETIQYEVNTTKFARNAN